MPEAGADDTERLADGRPVDEGVMVLAA